MAAISYTVAIGGNLQTVTSSTNAPSSGQIELRIDQTSTSVTDAATGGTRAPKKGEIQALIRVLEEYLIADTTVAQ
jgi:hypothetical protein